MGTTLAEAIRKRALALGFDVIRFARAELPEESRRNLREFLAAGRHGTMDWLKDRVEERSHPQALWPAANSVICLAISYAPIDDPRSNLRRNDLGNISVYARHRDYHDLLKGMLKHLAQFIVSRGGGEVKVFVDTAPVMEKPLAARAGIGWQGKHTNLVSREYGSWLFLGEIYTTLELESDRASQDHCGTCVRCLAACPTDAFPAPYQLDATRCISYLTIEHRGPIPEIFRPLVGNRIYGCDDCLAACPWNRFATVSRHLKLRARIDLLSPPLSLLAALDDGGFRRMFSGSPIKRIGRSRFARNVGIAIGNSGERKLRDVAAILAEDADPVVADAGCWAIKRLSE